MAVGLRHVTWRTGGHAGCAPVVERFPVQFAAERGFDLGPVLIQLAEPRLHLGGVDRIQVQLAPQPLRAAGEVDAIAVQSLER